MCVGLSVRWHMSKTTGRNFVKFLYMLSVALAPSSSDDNAICYVIQVYVIFHIMRDLESGTQRIIHRVTRYVAPLNCAFGDEVVIADCLVSFFELIISYTRVLLRALAVLSSGVFKVGHWAMPHPFVGIALFNF